MPCFRFLKNNLLLTIIIVFAFFLYTYRLGLIPPAVYVDEAVVAYDAYSIIETTKDHYGQKLPLYFKFFGSYTPGLFVYLQTLPVKLLGLTAYSIRIISILSMLLVAVGVYRFFTIHRLLRLKSSKMIGVLFFLITPWTVFNARLGYETTFAFALLSLGILFYQKPLLSFTLISLSTYAGHTQRYLAPLVLLLIYFIFHHRQKTFRSLLWPTILAFLIQIPNIIMLTTPAFWAKNDSLTTSFLTQYLSYFSPVDLFNRQDFDLQRSVPQLAVFYSWMFFPWLIGLYTLYKNRKIPIYHYLIALVLTTPLPAALANTNYSTQRALPLLLPYSLVIIIGFDRLLQQIKKSIHPPLLFFLTIFSLVLLWRSYFILFPVQRAKAWNSGYEKLAEFIKANPDQHFVIDNARTVPYILLLFHLKYPPSAYQLENPQNQETYYQDTNFSDQVKFANLEIRSINWKKDLCQNQILVGDNLSISSGHVEEHYLEQVFEAKDNHAEILLQGYRTRPDLKCPSKY
jgi:hypothetical protein